VAPKWKHVPAPKKQERHSDEIDWVAESATKQYRKIRKAPEAFKKKVKGNCYNYDKPGHFARDCKFRSAKTVQPARGKTPKRQVNAAEYDALSWIAYYDDSCLTYLSEKDGSGYFPQEGGRYEKDDDQI
jgi:hypothetical protein